MMEFCNYQQKKKDLSWTKLQVLRGQVIGGTAVFGLIIIFVLAPTGYFGPLSSRIRGLFVKHTKTGNPLVDSVAEHQPASEAAYFQNLHYFYYIAPVGLLIHSLRMQVLDKRKDSGLFLVLFGLVAYYFSAKMSRLIILLGPIASALGGVAIGSVATWSITQVKGFLFPTPTEDQEEKPVETKPVETTSKKGKKPNKRIAERKKKTSTSPVDQLSTGVKSVYDASVTKYVRLAIALVLLFPAPIFVFPTFFSYCDKLAGAMSHPSIMFKGTLNNGQTVMVDDYREAYWFLRDKTPQDSRVMAWWDYGYQITGIGNRTSIADGNTWNHEHIATLARCLVSPEKKAHRMIKHLADYVLIWTGGGGDDLAKSIHIGRIGNSVYPGLCSDAVCSKFGMSHSGPSKMMAKSLIYKLHSGKIGGKHFKQVFRSKYGKVKIYKVLHVSQESKKWVADPKNRICDAPGSWYCSGQYPPAFSYVLKKRKNFQQLENFNQKDKTKEAEKYQEEYMRGVGAR